MYMRKIILVVTAVALLGLVAFVLFLNAANTSTKGADEVIEDVTVACTQEAMICPDGSAVGREGVNCEFVACPVSEPATSTPADTQSDNESNNTPENNQSATTARLGGTTMISGVTIKPIELISDSRCPVGVECIWAGTVELRAVLTSAQMQGEYVLRLGDPLTLGAQTVTLVDVSPDKTQTDTNDSTYQFEFAVQ